ncbi:protein POLR1D-like [Sitodiplosis mosellana]|nr:protein POLR1D-like [Sitodiplosis mosellana]XP_055326089.1 protein POLR1D-like [Sitodiplosis mosellana]
MSTAKTDGQSQESEVDLTNRAIEEIQRETQRASRLAEEIGPSGWRMKTQRTNKRFLANTMRSVLSHNERTSVKYTKESKRKFEELSKRPPKFGTRLHSFQSSDERMNKEKNSTDSSTR